MKIALIGKSASGKDTIKNLLILAGFSPEVSYTSREPRVGEIQGTSYNFVTEEEFHKIDMIEKVCFNNWWYGTSVENFNNCNLFIFTPSGFKLLSKEHQEEFTCVYLTVSPEEQLRRLNKRGDDLTELHRRIESDRVDFENFTEYDLKIDSDKYNPHEIIIQIFDVLPLSPEFWQDLMSNMPFITEINKYKYESNKI